MGKRSSGTFPRRKHDAYFTPLGPALKLIPYLPARPFTFCEPCAGDGRLIRHLEIHSQGVCTEAYDIDPKASGITQRSALTLTEGEVDFFITNPPWTRRILHPMIEHLCSIRPTWLLFDADWKETQQAAPYLRFCKQIVAVGRVSWMDNGKAGKDNSAWYLFEAGNNAQTEFYGVTA